MANTITTFIQPPNTPILHITKGNLIKVLRNSVMHTT